MDLGCERSSRENRLRAQGLRCLGFIMDPIDGRLHDRAQHLNRIFSRGRHLAHEGPGRLIQFDLLRPAKVAKAAKVEGVGSESAHPAPLAPMAARRTSLK